MRSSRTTGAAGKAAAVVCGGENSASAVVKTRTHSSSARGRLSPEPRKGRRAGATSIVLSSDAAIRSNARSESMLRAVLENGGPAGAGAKRGLFYTNCFEPLRAVPVLSTSARRVLTTENAGGSSEFSEALSFEVLHRAYNAKLVATEMEIAYYPLGSKRTDYVVEILGSTLGVSVSRAMAHRGVFTPSDARALLWKKLSGVQASTANVLPRGLFTRQLLHIWAPTLRVARILRRVYCKDSALNAVRGSTVVLVTVSGASASAAAAAATKADVAAWRAAHSQPSPKDLIFYQHAKIGQCSVM
eukprot:tig00000851_g4887.t1